MKVFLEFAAICIGVLAVISLFFIGVEKAWNALMDYLKPGRQYGKWRPDEPEAPKNCDWLTPPPEPVIPKSMFDDWPHRHY